MAASWTSIGSDRAHAVDVDFVRVEALGLEEELVLELLGELDDLSSIDGQ